MKTPTTVTELWCFMGMVNQLGKFTPHLADFAQPLRIPSEKATLGCGTLIKTKHSLASKKGYQSSQTATVFALYDSQVLTTLSADTSSYGLGTVLLQESNTQWRLVAYASYSMMGMNQHYTEIEKEALGITSPCEKFSD